MSCLIKKNKRDYYSRVSVRVGDRQSNKRKDVNILSLEDELSNN